MKITKIRYCKRIPFRFHCLRYLIKLLTYSYPIQKITIKELIEFKRKPSDRIKKNFAFKLKTRPIKIRDENDKSGGDYWVISTSSIYNTFKYGKDDYYNSKIEELQLKHKNTEDKGVKKNCA